MKNTSIVFTALLAGLLLSGCLTGDGTAESDTITVAYLPSYQSLPLFVAIEKGMFEQAGLKVNVQRIETPKDIIDGLVTGKIDAGAPSVAAGITTIVESQNPGALKVYALTCSYKEQLIDEVLVPKNSTVSSISDLKGKKIGHIPGIQWQTMTKKTLLANGIDPKEVTLLELPISSQLPTLASGSVDAIFTLEPTGTIGEKNGAARILVKAPFEQFVVDPWCGGAGVVSARFLQNKPEAAKKFIAVMKEVMKQTPNPENRQYLVQYLQLPADASNRVDLPNFIPVAGLTPEIVSAYQTFADAFFELGATQKKIDVRNLFLSGS